MKTLYLWPIIRKTKTRYYNDEAIVLFQAETKEEAMKKARKLLKENRHWTNTSKVTFKHYNQNSI